jgi:hypothetical protein
MRNMPTDRPCNTRATSWYRLIECAAQQGGRQAAVRAWWKEGQGEARREGLFEEALRGRSMPRVRASAEMKRSMKQPANG